MTNEIEKPETEQVQGGRNDDVVMCDEKTPCETNCMGFKADLERLINIHNMENGSNTPDFILAEYINDCLISFEKAASRRAEWYAPEPKNT